MQQHESNGRPTKKMLEAMSLTDLYERLVNDESNSWLYRNEIRAQMSAQGITFKDIMVVTTPNTPAAAWQNKPNKKTTTQPRHVPERGYWGGDAELARNFEDARLEFLDHYEEFWQEERCIKATGRYEKEPDDIYDFLVSIEGKEYNGDPPDGLTGPQKGLLGTIRRTHQYWIRHG
jgi:hypothetical protein